MPGLVAKTIYRILEGRISEAKACRASGASPLDRETTPDFGILARNTNPARSQTSSRKNPISAKSFGNQSTRLLKLTALVSLLLGGQAHSQGLPLLDEVMGYEGTDAIKYDSDDPNHRSVARIAFLGCTIAADGDYQYWYDLRTGNKAWTRDVSFWVSHGDSIMGTTVSH